MSLPRRWRPLLVLVLSVPLACTIVLGITVALRPPLITSHGDAIRYMLRQRNVSYEWVRASLPWPESMNYFAYGSSVYPFNLLVRARLADGTDVLGRVECRDDQRDCWLTLVGAGIDGERLRDVDQTAPPDWLRQLRKYLPWLPI